MTRQSWFWLAGMLWPGILAAQEDIPEVMVAGERLARPPNETASSLTVVAAEELALLPGVDRIEQLLDQTPNVQLGSGSEGPTLRGQDSTGVLRDLPGFLGGARPRATLRVDGRDVGFNEFVFGVAPLWDVRQVEIFRTPQTTTQGRNAIAGGLFIQTEDPVHHWQARARAIGGNYASRQGSIALSAPFVPGQLAMRIAGDVRRSRTTSELGDRIDAADPNRDRYSSWRAKILLEPAALPQLRLQGTFVHSTSTQPQIESVTPPFEARRDPAPGYGVFATQVDSQTLVARYRIAESLLSTTTLSHGRVSSVRHAPPGLGEADTVSRDGSIESLMDWRPTGGLRLLGGVNALRTDLDQDINLSAVLGQGTFTDRQESLGLFGDAEWSPVPRWTATAGLRYERDSQQRRGSIVGPRVSLPIDFDRRFRAWLPRFSLSYELGADSRVGMLVQRAYNPGGTTLNLDNATQLDFDAERLWNQELYARAGFAQGRGTLAANVFRTQFQDSQRAQPRVFRVPGGGAAFWAEIINVPRARAQGIEAELAWRFTNALQVRAGLGLLDTRITRTNDPTGALTDKQFARAPQVTASLAVNWQPLPHWFVSAQGRLNGGYFSDDANTPARRIDAARVMNVSVGYRRERWALHAYARNAFDRFYLTSLLSSTLGTAGEPRRIGMVAELRL